jgi:23S rRNA (pseudouridine1915-N3)-methyltransferase
MIAVYRKPIAPVLSASGFTGNPQSIPLRRTLGTMQITLAHIGTRTQRSGAKAAFETLTSMYVERVQPYHPMRTELFRSEDELLAWFARQHGRAAATLVLADSRGRPLSSAEFAAWVGARRDAGAQHLVFAIGPPDGWSAAARSQALLQLSFGALTLAHELARLVAAEQIYRACTILAGHPYHGGH